MKKRSLVILIGASVLGGTALWWLAAYEPVHQGWCKLRRVRAKTPTESALVTLASQIATHLPAAPNDVTDVPTTFKRPSFYRMRTGHRTIDLVVDFSGRPRLCVDTNGNGSFADEKEFRVRSFKDASRKSNRFGPIPLILDSDDHEKTLAFYAIIYRRDEPGPMWLYPTYGREGRLRIGKSVYKVAMMNGDFDARFGSVVSLPVYGLGRWPHCDVIAIDFNRDGKFQRSDYGRSEVMPLGRLIRLDRQYYTVDITEDGSRLELTATDPEQGALALDLPETKIDLRLWSDAADQYISFATSGTNLPAGRYQALRAVLRMRDANNHEWTFGTNGNVGDLDLFEIRAGQTTPLKLGPPFVVTAKIEQRNGLHLISPVLRGRAGEEYQLDFKRNGRRPPKRAFKIVAEDGTVLANSTFEYG